MAISSNLRALLRCPKCREPLVEDGERLVCTDPETRLAYPIRDGIPVMVVDEATALSPDEWEAVMGRHQTGSAE